MIDEDDISDSVISMNTVVSLDAGGIGMLERLRIVNQLVQADDGQGEGPRLLYKLDDKVTHESIGDRFTIGRSKTCALQVDDPKLSREHLEITSADGSHTVRDLDSKNGIKVNNRRVREKILNPGDLIAAGKNTFVYVED